MSLSLVIPTLGRPTLLRTLESLLPQLQPDDEVIVVSDGDEAYKRAQSALWKAWPQTVFGSSDPRGYLTIGPASGCWGNAQRDRGMEIASGTHLMFIDDDDVYEPGALEHVRAAIADAPDKGLAQIFRIRFGFGHPAGPLGGNHPPIWTERALRSSNVATPMVVLPNRPSLPRWADGDDADMLSDFVFIRRAVSKLGGAYWHERVIATVRP